MVCPEKRICLNMIVKNESKVIKRCLQSVKHLIDYWVIVDTGSSDGTQKIIREFLKDIPGDLFERPWKNFEHNRNEALHLGYPKAHNLMFIDADEELKATKSFSLGVLDKDIFLIPVHLPNGTVFRRQLIISTRIKWFWRGVVHEQVYTNEKQTTHRFIEDAYIFAQDDGGRTGADSRAKFLNDAQILEEALKKEPKNSRYMFYLANSYFNAKELPLAIKAYEKRALMGGWDQEVYYSLYNIARIQKEMKMPAEKFIGSFFKAYRYRPSRAEPLFWIANFYIEQKNYEKACKLLQEATSIPLSDDAMMVEIDMYQFIIPWMLADCFFFLNQFDEALKRYQELIKKPGLPKELGPHIQRKILMIPKRKG